MAKKLENQGHGPRVSEAAFTDLEETISRSFEHFEFWQVEGAVHAEGLKTQPAEYERRVLNFYQQYLGGERGARPLP